MLSLNVYGFVSTNNALLGSQVMLLYRLIHGICLECIACGGPGNYIIHGIWLERIAYGGPGNYIIHGIWLERIACGGPGNYIITH